jgi:hypothetical protein
MDYQWRVMSDKSKHQRWRRHAVAPGYAPRDVALCGEKPPIHAHWINEPVDVKTCGRCERKVHVRRLVMDL